MICNMHVVYVYIYIYMYMRTFSCDIEEDDCIISSSTKSSTDSAGSMFDASMLFMDDPPRGVVLLCYIVQTLRLKHIFIYRSIDI